jgi:hypothetical protein
MELNYNLYQFPCIILVLYALFTHFILLTVIGLKPVQLQVNNKDLSSIGIETSYWLDSEKWIPSKNKILFLNHSVQNGYRLALALPYGYQGGLFAMVEPQKRETDH